MDQLEIRQTVKLLYGRDDLAVSVPQRTTVLEGQHIKPLADPKAVMSEALLHPIGTLPLVQLVRKRRPDQVAITISDITRPVPNELIVTSLLADLNNADISDDKVVIIIGTGMHRPSTPQERVEMLGSDLLRRCEVIDHHGDDSQSLVPVSDDPPVSINRRFVEASFRIVTGLIEPHFMAGFSGGRKGVCPALADFATVQRFHSYGVLADPKSTTGVLADNPCHAESLRVAQLVGVDFLANVAIDRQRNPVSFYCGDIEKAHLAGATEVGKWTSAEFDELFDLIITHGGGYPLDQTFYQSVKGMVTPLPAMHEATTLLIVSRCGEGIGSPQYTQTMMRWGQDWQGFLKSIAGSDQVVKDQWQYQMHARLLSKIGIDRLHFITNEIDAETLRRLAVNPVLGSGSIRRQCQDFIDMFVAAHPAARIAVIPDGPYTNPVPSDSFKFQMSRGVA